MHHERAQAHTSVQWVYQLNLISTKVAGFIPALLACSSCVCLCSLTSDSGSRSQFKDAHNRLIGSTELAMHEEYERSLDPHRGNLSGA